MIKVCYVDFWCDLCGSPVTIESITDSKSWIDVPLSRRRYMCINEGIGLLHINELKKYLDVCITQRPEEADVLICSCFGNVKDLYPNKKKIYLGFEAQCGIFNQPNTLFISNFSRADDSSYYLNLYCLYQGFSIYKQLKEPRTVNMSMKTNFCLSIISNPAQPFRRQFIVALSNKYKTVHNFGKLLKNRRDNLIENTTWYDPRLSQKIEQYKFMICFENQELKGYHTEKIVNGFVGHTIPIYWGDPEIEEHFNSEAFINVSKLGIDKAIERIIELDNNSDMYEHVLSLAPITPNQTTYKYIDEQKFRSVIGGTMTTNTPLTVI